MDQGSVDQVKAALRSQDSAGQFWSEKLSPWLGSSWLDEGDTVLADSLDSWTTPEEADALTPAAEYASSDQGAALINWLDDLLNRMEAAPAQEETDPAQDTAAPAARYTNITPVDGYPGWWQGWDSTNQEWSYANTTETPDDTTTEWVDQNFAYAQMIAPLPEPETEETETDTAVEATAQDTAAPAARYTNITPVDGYPGWWQGWDSTNQEWSYANTTETPDDTTTEWVNQDLAYARMIAPLPEPEQLESRSDVLELMNNPDSELEAALAGFSDPKELLEGVDLTGYTVEEIRRALIDAITEG